MGGKSGSQKPSGVADRLPLPLPPSAPCFPDLFPRLDLGGQLPAERSSVPREGPMTLVEGRWKQIILDPGPKGPEIF